MTPDEFRQRLKALDMTQRNFADRLALDYRTVSRWGKPGRDQNYDFPVWVGAILSAWERAIDLAARYLETEEGAAEALAELAAKEIREEVDNKRPLAGSVEIR